jgi:hypothetical protein
MSGSLGDTATQIANGMAGNVSGGTTMSALQQTANTVASLFGIPSNLFTAQINAESGFNPNAVNASSGATGIAQFIPSTVQSINNQQNITFNPNNPTQSLYQAGYLDANDLVASNGNWVQALEDYGTLPSNASTASLNPAQTSLYNIANALDGGSSVSSQGAAGTDTSTPVASSTTTPASSCSGISSLFTFSCYSGILDNGALIVIALILLVGGFLIIGGKAITNVAPTITRAKAKFA